MPYCVKLTCVNVTLCRRFPVSLPGSIQFQALADSFRQLLIVACPRPFRGLLRCADGFVESFRRGDVQAVYDAPTLCDQIV